MVAESKGNNKILSYYRMTADCTKHSQLIKCITLLWRDNIEALWLKPQTGVKWFISTKTSTTKSIHRSQRRHIQPKSEWTFRFSWLETLMKKLLNMMQNSRSICDGKQFIANMYVLVSSYCQIYTRFREDARERCSPIESIWTNHVLSQVTTVYGRVQFRQKNNSSKML